jgi:acyl-CoA synthetase (AMP-forming)/AMP-acid ligase II
VSEHRVVLHDLEGIAHEPSNPATRRSFPTDFDPTIPGLLARATECFGDLPFVVTSSHQYSYADIDAASRKLAQHFVARGVGKGTRVGLLLPQGPMWIVAFLAAARCGALTMGFSTFYTPSELRRSLVHGDVELLIVAEEMFGKQMLPFVLETAPGLGSTNAGRSFLQDLPFLRSVTMLGEQAGSGLATSPDPGWLDRFDVFGESSATPLVDIAMLASLEAQVTPADLLITIYTSGTTSEPKGVVHTHGAQVRHGINLAGLRGYSPESRLFAHMPFFWVGGFTCALIPALFTGAMLITQERLDTAEALDLIQEHAATQLVAWPNVRHRLMADPTFDDRDLRDIAFFAPALAAVDPGLMHNSLGMTETSGPHSAAGPDEYGTALPEHHRGSFGRRVPYVQHRVAHPETNKTVGDGEQGEVCIRGYSVMAGMYKIEREDTFDADGWYHTGDRVHFEDDLLFFHGRYGEMIKTAGSNVAPREVEVALEALDEVKMALVFGMPDAERGQVVVAGVVASPGADLDPEELRAALRGVVSTYKVPRSVVVFADEDIPMLASGKPNRRKVESLLSDRLR